MDQQPAWMEKVLNNKKYRALNLTEETLLDLMAQVEGDGLPKKQVEKAVREKLHNIVAPYLEDVDYEAATLELLTIAPDDKEALYAFGEKMLRAHTSTDERMETLQAFYGAIAAQLPQKGQIRIADLACAMNPFAIQWMQLPTDCEFYAYDLNGARIDLLNLYFEKCRLNARALHADIIANPVQEAFDAVFFFKEAHRFEQRHKGSTRQFLLQLNAPLIFVSLPSQNMTGRHDLSGKHIRIMEEAIAGTDWQMEIKEFGKELLFIIRK
jgi:16S rRNA (guanine(1405)-N(7))-methyltransferase